MPVPSSINDLSTTAGSNSPSGSEAPTEGDNYLRTAFAFIATLRDAQNGTSTMNAPTISGGTFGAGTVSNPTFTGTPGGVIAASTYTPTLTNVTNVSSSTADLTLYIRVGDTVFVSGQLTLVPTTASFGTQIDISLPISSALTSYNQLAGSASGVGATVNLSARVVGNPVNDRASMSFTCDGATGSRAFSFNFMYRVL